MGWKAEVLVQGSWSQNAEVWPDEQSALKAGHDLMGRWMLVQDHRAVEVDEEPNRPAWKDAPRMPRRVTL